LGLGSAATRNAGTIAGNVLLLSETNKLPALDATLLMGIQSVPVGATLEWNSNTEPTNYMFEDGRAISRTTYATLFSVIGTAFGSGDGSTTFNIPNSIDRVAVASGSLYGLNSKGGSKDAIVVAHSHGVNDPGHTHNIRGGGGNFDDYGNFLRAGPNSADNASRSSTTGITIQDAGSSGTNANMPPYIGKRKIIRVL
jgi:microcystin-dependent protein